MPPLTAPRVPLSSHFFHFDYLATGALLGAFDGGLLWATFNDLACVQPGAFLGILCWSEACDSDAWHRRVRPLP
jgi:hypothetical protein